MFTAVIEEEEAVGARPQISITMGASEALLEISGELDMALEGEVAEAIERACSDVGAAAIAVDVTQVTFIDSSGLRSLVRARMAATSRGITFRLICPESGPVPRLLELARLKGWFG